MRRLHRRSRQGFTLIEIMAVVLIIGLMMGLVLPNLAATRASSLEQRAREVASRIEIARERSILTGEPHRVMIDVEEGVYLVEWWVTESRASGQSQESQEEEEPSDTSAAPDPPDYSSGGPISLEPPRGEQRDYYPIPTRFGDEQWLPDDYFFEGVETPGGYIDEGSVMIVFERDGTTDYAEIVVADAWENRVVLEIQPLLDIVRIHHDESD